MRNRAIIFLLLVTIFSCSKEDVQELPELNITPYEDNRPFGDVIAKLIEFQDKHFPEISKSLRPPASDEELDRLEQLIQAKLPEEFRKMYKISDGQETVNKPFFHNGYEFMSISEIIDTWKMMKELYDSEPDFRIEGVSSQGPVRDIWWHPKWIPFGYMTSGDHYCIDLYPAETGKVGQIIEFIHDDIPRRHLGYSTKDFLGEYETGLRNNKYFMHEEWNVIVSDPES